MFSASMSATMENGDIPTSSIDDTDGTPVNFVDGVSGDDSSAGGVKMRA